VRLVGYLKRHRKEDPEQDFRQV